MDSIQEDRYGMYLKVDLFLVNNAAALAFNPAIATTRTSLNSFINLIAQSDSTATRDITGFTAAKNEHKTQQKNQFKLVRAALMGYFTANPDIKKKTMIDFSDSEIDRFRDSELYMKTDQLLDIALPIKALLVPFGVAAAQVDALDTLNGLWQSMEPSNRMEEAVNKASGEDVDRYMAQTTELLDKTLDSYLKVVQYTAPNLYSQYQTARMIDDSGGGSDSQGYEVSNMTIPAGSSVIMPFPGTDMSLELYLRVIGGSGVYICSTDGTTGPCTTGYLANPSVTYKGPLSGLGLNPAMPHVQITNPGTVDVVVRSGPKT